MGHLIAQAQKAYDADTATTTTVKCTGNACVKNASGGYTQQNGVSIVTNGTGNHTYSNISAPGKTAANTMTITTTSKGATSTTKLTDGSAPVTNVVQQNGVSISGSTSGDSVTRYTGIHSGTIILLI